MTKLRLVLAAGLAAAAVAPVSAHAYTCMPHFRAETVNVAGQDVTVLVYDGMVC